MELDRDRIEQLHRMIDRRLLGGVRSEGQLVGVLSHSVPHGDLILNCRHAAAMVVARTSYSCCSRAAVQYQVYCTVYNAFEVIEPVHCLLSVFCLLT